MFCGGFWRFSLVHFVFHVSQIFFSDTFGFLLFFCGFIACFDMFAIIYCYSRNIRLYFIDGYSSLNPSCLLPTFQIYVIIFVLFVLVISLADFYRNICFYCICVPCLYTVTFDVLHVLRDHFNISCRPALVAMNSFSFRGALCLSLYSE